jgi:hypothetical protein
VRHFRLSLSEIWRDVEPRKKRKNKARVSKQNTPKAKKRTSHRWHRSIAPHISPFYSLLAPVGKAITKIKSGESECF